MADLERHECRRRGGKYRMRGHAIDDCDEDARGFFWVWNDEYASPVNYCPFCGMKAPRPASETKFFPYQGDSISRSVRDDGYGEP